MGFTSWQDQLFSNIHNVELMARMGMTVCFGLSTFCFAFLLQGPTNRFQQPLLALARLLFLLGTFSLLAHAVVGFILPLNTFLPQLYALNGLVFAAPVFFIDFNRKESAVVSFILSALLFLSMTLWSFLEPAILLQSERSNWLINVHVVLSVLGEFLFVISFCASFIFILNHRKLKKKIIDTQPSSASLSSLENLTVWSSFIGMAFITLALITGLLLILVGKNTIQIGFLKIFWAFFVWGWYAITILGRGLWGWRGRKGAWLIVMGCIFLMVGLLMNFYYYMSIK